MPQPLNVLLMCQGIEKGGNIAPSLGLHRLKHFISERNINCHILDHDVQSAEPYLEAASKGEYQIKGLSVSHTKMISDLDILWEFRKAQKKSGKPCLFMGGGQEATMNYKQWLDLGIDLVCLGFAEEALYEVCQKWSQYREGNPNTPPPALPLESIFGKTNGVAYRQDPENLAYRPIDNLTEEKFRHLSFTQVMAMDMPYDMYWNKVRRERIDAFNKADFIPETVRLYTSSHCPRKCGFCSSQTFLPFSQDQNSPIIMLSAQEVHDLVVNHVQKYKARAFLFSDDDFPIGNKWGLERLSQLTQMLIESKNNGLIPKETKFFCQNRIADYLVYDPKTKEKRVNTELLEKIKKAGFHNLGFGVETFSESLLKGPSINKMGVTVKDCLKVLDAVLDQGIVPQIFLILGIPESTADDLIQTMDTALEYIKKGCDMAVTPYMRVFPGSPMSQKEGYNVCYEEWTHPETGETILIADKFIPSDPKIAEVAEHIETVAQKEMERIKNREGWDKTILPKSLVGMSRFIAVAKILERDELYEKYNEYVYSSVDIKSIKAACAP